MYEPDRDQATTVLNVTMTGVFQAAMKMFTTQNCMISLRQTWRSIIMEIVLEDSGPTKLHSFARNCANSERKIWNGLLW